MMGRQAGLLAAPGVELSRVLTRLPAMRTWREELGVIAIIAVLSAVAFAAIMLHDGYFTYTIDAPYDHLTVADQILRGNYGINAGEPDAAVSSILYPFLLAPLVAAGAGMYAPLIVTFAATVAIGVLLCRIADEAAIPLRQLPFAGFIALACAVILALNLIGLEFTGLEHSLHVALALGSFLGFVRFLRRHTADWWWLACIVLQPLIRFEGIAFLAIEVCFLIAFGKYRPAAIVVGATAVLLGGFCLFLHALGLPPIPNSIIERSGIVAESLGQIAKPSSPIAILIANFKSNLFEYGGALITMMVAALFAWFAGPRDFHVLSRDTIAKGSVVIFAALTSLAQLVGGSLGSYSRYEIYILALDFAALAVVYREPVARWTRSAGLLRCGVMALLIVVAFSGYVRRNLVTPEAAANVFEQQYQLNRLATEFYRGPIATDHLGWVAYRNPYYVLDLMGVGSERARELREHAKTPAWMDGLARDHGIGLAMMYPNLDPRVPVSWQPVAELRLTDRAHTVAGPIVRFFAVTPQDRTRILAALRRFGPTLPEGDALIFLRAKATTKHPNT